VLKKPQNCALKVLSLTLKYAILFIDNKAHFRCQFGVQVLGSNLCKFKPVKDQGGLLPIRGVSTATGLDKRAMKQISNLLQLNIREQLRLAFP
jgi:hypothetical protein